MTETESQSQQKRGHLVIFYLLTTAIACMGWIPFAAYQVGLLHWRIPVEIPIVAQYSPTLAAFILIAFEGGRDGLRTFLKSFVRWRIGVQWYVVALLTAPLMGISLIALHAFEGKYVPTIASLQGWQFHVAAFIENLGGVSGGTASSSGLFHSLARWASWGVWPAALVILGLATANGGLSEEAGWRGYALTRLLPGRRALLASLWVGLMWGLWHTGPAFWIGIFQKNWSVVAVPIEYTLGTVPLSVLICWVFINAKRSLLPGILFHASYNSTFFFLTALWTPGKPVVSVLEWLAATIGAALLAILIGRQSLLARSSTAKGASRLESTRELRPVVVK